MRILMTLACTLLITGSSFAANTFWGKAIQGFVLVTRPMLSDLNKHNWNVLYREIEGTNLYDDQEFEFMERMEDNHFDPFANNQSIVVHRDDLPDEEYVGEIPDDIEDVIDMYNNPRKWEGIMPGGTLLVGPPGTGKTSLVRHIARQTGCHLIHQAGSQFVELYVGMGAKRVRELFDEARQYILTHPGSRVIIFIDEIDAVGGRRTQIDGGGDREYQQTLNELLNQMDGFKQQNDIIVIGATNRADVLDEALKRTGRFDHIIKIGLPNYQVRKAVLNLYAKKYCPNNWFGTDIDLNAIAAQTAGLNNADLKGIALDARKNAIRHDRYVVTHADFEYAMHKMLEQKRY